jgi:hypothetical protein
MEARIDFLRWLSKKLYLITVGTYATIGLIMLLPPLIAMHFSIPMAAASFGVFFVVAFLRAAYESLVIYEAPAKNLSLYKMLTLTLVTSSVISLASAYLKPKVGYFSIPLAIIISMVVVGRLKELLWGATQRPGFFAELPAKLDLVALGRYGFYGFLVGITYMGYAKYGIDFYYAFAAGYFIGMIFEELYNLIRLYEQKLEVKYVVPMILWSAFCSIVSAAIVWVMMSMLGYSGQPATIVSVLLLKLVQPLGSNKFILRF